MYSHKDRIGAVEPYIRLSKRVRPTIRQLVYPTKNFLNRWSRQYQQRLDLPVGYTDREPKFSQAQKAAVIEHYLTRDRCIVATMSMVGYPARGTLTTWVREAHPAARSAIDGNVGRRRYLGNCGPSLDFLLYRSSNISSNTQFGRFGMVKERVESSVFPTTCPVTPRRHGIGGKVSNLSCMSAEEGCPPKVEKSTALQHQLLMKPSIKFLSPKTL
jgi:hypothetical protein